MVPWPGGQTGHCVQHVRAFLGSRLRVQCWLLAWLSPPHSAIRCSRCDSIAKTSTGGQPTPTCSKVSRERASFEVWAQQQSYWCPTFSSQRRASHTLWLKRYSLPAFKFKQFYLADTKNDRIRLLTIALFQLQSWESITLRARWTR